MGAINCERFLIARFGQFHAARVLVNVTQMPDGVCERERVAINPADGDRLIIELPRGIAIPHVALDLAESFEGLCQFALSACVTAESDRVGKIQMSDGQTILSSRALPLFHELYRRMRHRPLTLDSLRRLPHDARLPERFRGTNDSTSMDDTRRNYQATRVHAHNVTAAPAASMTTITRHPFPSPTVVRL